MTRGWWLIAVVALLVPVPGAAQLACPAPAPADSATTPPDRPPDIVVRATVTARSLRFASAPRIQIRTSGCAPWDSVIETERVNLPDPVEPGVTYRDIRVGVEIRSWLDLRCLLPAAPAAPAADSVAARPADPCVRLLGPEFLRAPARQR